MSEGIRGGRPSMRGSSRLRPRPGQVPAAAPQGGTTLYHHLPPDKSPVGKKRVLFVCIGNSCRSQMAEGFARKYGNDCLAVQSAGLSPAAIVQDETHRTMLARGVVLAGQFPKGIELLAREPFDLIVNMSGHPLPKMNGRVETWPVKDPIGLSEEVYATVADQIEQRVMRLIVELRPA
jgi:arsenate reductase (thioredoxin)